MVDGMLKEIKLVSQVKDNKIILFLIAYRSEIVLRNDSNFSYNFR
jgi:hypothetical protein